MTVLPYLDMRNGPYVSTDTRASGIGTVGHGRSGCLVETLGDFRN